MRPRCELKERVDGNAAKNSERIGASEAPYCAPNYISQVSLRARQNPAEINRWHEASGMVVFDRSEGRGALQLV